MGDVYDRGVPNYRGVLAVVAVACVLAGCASPETSSEAVPEGITVSVYQTRTDVGPRRLEVSIGNQTGGPLGITGVRFESEQFVETAVWAKESTRIPAGATVDLPVLLTEANCSAENPEPVVEFDYVLDDGSTGTARTIAIDRLDRLPALMVEDCMAQAVADVAVLTIASAPRASTIAGNPVVELDLAVDPTGGQGTLELETLHSTTLFMPADPVTGEPTTSQPLSVTITGTDEPSIVTLVLTPGRCDPHAVAEDKLGTVMPIDVVASGVAGRISVPSADAVRGALYTFVTDACS